MVKVTSNADRAMMLPYTNGNGETQYAFLDYKGHCVLLDDSYYEQVMGFGYKDKIIVEVVH